MELFNAARFVKLSEQLGKITGLVQEESAKTRELPETTLTELGLMAHDVREDLVPLGLPVSIRSAERLIALSRSDGATQADLAKLAEELAGRISDEMQSRLFLALTPDQAKYYQTPDLFGDEVTESFPAASFDIEEAGKCLALDRGTAAVFHLMRVLETGLYALADELNITPEENWHNAIEQIESAIKKLGKGRPGGNASNAKKAEHKNAVQFYSEAATQFMFLKDAWRNRAAHTGQVYTVEKARAIFGQVEQFMRHLATRLGDG